MSSVKELRETLSRSQFRLSAKRKQAWLNALRGGEYKQGYGRLKTIEDGSARHCCLGVYAEAVLGAEEDVSGNCARYFTFGNGETNGTMLPRTYIPLRVQDALAMANDSRAVSFADIADAVEEYL